MNDPKYAPVINGFLHVQGQYIVPHDEPCMLLRGKDIGALAAISAYIEMLEQEPPNKVVNAHLDSSLERLEAFYSYQINNPELQSVGCSREHHGSAQVYLEHAKSILKRYPQ